MGRSPSSRIAGRPNVGKFSLSNSLLGEARAIVAEHPEITRDAIEALLTVEGCPFRLVDTAGLLSGADRVESLGLEVAGGLPGAGGSGPVFRGRRPAAGRGGAHLPAVLVEQASLEEAGVQVTVSAVRGDGLQALRQFLVEAAYAGVGAGAETPLVTRRRQTRAIRRAPRDSGAFLNARDAGLPPEIAATHLLDAQRALEELPGVVETEDALDLVFSSFCIGK